MTKASALLLHGSQTHRHRQTRTERHTVYSHSQLTAPEVASISLPLHGTRTTWSGTPKAGKLSGTFAVSGTGRWVFALAL